MVINERDIRNAAVRALAEAVMTAARTAPKAKGRDTVEVAMVTEDDIARLSRTMVEMSGESGMKFLLRDAANIMQAEAVIIIGVRGAGGTCGLDCGYCGFASCGLKPASVPCTMNGVDVGIAIGSACAAIADLRLDSRVMFSAGWAARRLEMLPGADLVFGIPLAASSKNPFFDRKSPAQATGAVGGK